MLIRVEQPADHRPVEEMTREAFWNLYMAGAEEHYLLHVMRNRPEFIAELCLVAVDETSGEILASIAFTRSSVTNPETGIVHDTITFGPVSVARSQQGKGVGSALIKEALKKATDMGFKAVVILGHPSFYRRFGFKNGQHFGISARDGTFPKGLQCLELVSDGLKGVRGMFKESDVFNTDAADVEEFDKSFPPKRKFLTYSQKAYQVVASLKNEDPDPVDIFPWRVEEIVE